MTMLDVSRAALLGSASRPLIDSQVRALDLPGLDTPRAAIVIGKEQGQIRNSAYLLGSAGQLGNSTFGRYGENVTVSANNGNLAINRTGRILIGQGPDSVISRAYNSTGSLTGFGAAGNGG